jgi:hypothetical protein
MAIARHISGRAALAALLFAGGVASLVYGAVYHSAPVERNVVETQVVQEEHEEMRELPFGQALPGVGPDGTAFPDPGIEPPPDGPAFGPPPGFPGAHAPKVKVIVVQPVEKKVIKPVVEYEPEPIVVFEVTRGGVELADSGTVRRTYGPTANGEQIEPPSMCPT